MITKLNLSNIISKESFNSWVFFLIRNWFYTQCCLFSKWIDRICYNPSILDSTFSSLAMGNYYCCSNFCFAINPCQSIRCESFVPKYVVVFDKYSLLLGESEYWFAMIKVVMIVLFLIVGLIYDWGGIKGHPGPVGPFIVLTRTFLNEIFYGGFIKF